MPAPAATSPPWLVWAAARAEASIRASRPRTKAAADPSADPFDDESPAELASDAAPKDADGARVAAWPDAAAAVRGAWGPVVTAVASAGTAAAGAAIGAVAAVVAVADAGAVDGVAAGSAAIAASA